MDELEEEPAVCPRCGPATADVEYTEIVGWPGRVVAKHRTATQCSACGHPVWRERVTLTWP